MSAATEQPILSVEKLAKQYSGDQIGKLRSVDALRGISFTVHRGRTLSLVGKSGSGKSTLARCIACIDRPSSGKIWFEGRNLVGLTHRQIRQVRPQIQLVFQDPASSLNPKMTAMEILAEPLKIQRRMPHLELMKTVAHLLDQVRLPAAFSDRRPMEFSGGGRQRLAIARALALKPKLLILDEALSALDCSVQAQIANLLVELQRSLGVAYIFITHNFDMAAHLSDEIAVLENGQIVEREQIGAYMTQPRTIAARTLMADSKLIAPARATQ